ncbi:MAG: dTMP kinase [Bacillota bacterium]|nr:dTMP kinase [Bacillota bacterium]
MFISRGYLITLEGIDGCGKSTQVSRLQQFLSWQNIPFVSVREPGGTPAGEDIRKILLQNDYPLSLQCELLLYMTARSELADQIIIPALLAGKLVICDRYTDSTLAYQGYGGGADISWIRELNHKVTRGISPDLTFLLDLPVSEAFSRRGNNNDRMEQNDLAYYHRVRDGYLELARMEPHRFIVINASKGIEDQEKLIGGYVKELTNKRLTKEV